ncbi:hypothetical protein COSO111634_02120 [Corallococcus soli]
MRDASLETLSDVLDHSAAGGQTRAPNGGQTRPLQSPFVRGFTQWGDRPPRWPPVATP